MTKDLSVISKPQSLTEAMNLAQMISQSSFAPKGMQNRPGDILLAWQLGVELGLSLIQALTSIAVINGKPTLYGDAALAVVQSHPDYVNHREWHEGTIEDGSRVAYCAITRAGSEEHIVGFSMKDAKKANLWGKTGPWTQYPDRMLQMRARGFCIRDKFSDALRGLITREEAEDYQAPAAAPQKILLTEIEEPAFDFSGIAKCETVDELKALYMELKEKCKSYPNHYKMLNDLTSDHKTFLERKFIEETEQYDEPLSTDGGVSEAVG